MFLQNRDYMEAERSFERYLRHNPDGPARWEAWNQLLEMAVNVRHNRNSAIDLLEIMKLEYQNQPEKLRQVKDRLATEYELLHAYGPAVELWSDLVNDQGTSDFQKARYYRNLARIYLRRLEFQTAKESLSCCLELNVPQSEKSSCQYELAEAYMVMEEFDAGIKELRALLTRESVDEDLRVLAIFMLADALEQQNQPGNKETALELFESIRHSYPNTRVVATRIEFLKSRKK